MDHKNPSSGNPAKDPTAPKTPPAEGSPPVHALSAQSPLVLRGKELLKKAGEESEDKELDPLDLFSSISKAQLTQEDEDLFRKVLPSGGEKFGRIPTMRSELGKLEKSFRGQ